MLPGTCTRPEIRVKLFCEDPQAVCDAQRPLCEYPNDKNHVWQQQEPLNPTQAASEY